MSNIVKAKVTAGVPANYEEALAAEALEMKKRIGAISSDFIGINKDKTFRMPGGETAPTLAAVVLGFVSMNQFYEGRYDPKNVQPPVCMAVGQEIATLRPFDKVPKKQNDDCGSCWANQWGTDGKGKACKNQRLLALLAPGAQEDGAIMLLKVSPTATRYWDNYVVEAMAVSGALIKLITLIACDPNVDYASLRFKIQGMNEDWQTAFGRRTVAMERLLAEPDFAPAVVAEKPRDKAA